MKKSKTAASVAPVHQKSFFRKAFDSKTLLLMCLPAIAFFIIFCYCPLPGVYIAFTNYNFRDGIFGSPFVGFKNFEFLVKIRSVMAANKKYCFIQHCFSGFRKCTADCNGNSFK